MNIRKLIFFMLDKDKMVYNQLKEIDKINTDDTFYKKFHKSCIENLITHVNNTVPFYKRRAITNFKDFPVVSKIMMKENPKDFLSSENLKIGKIRHTSGSTGIPFKIVQDYRKAKRIQAELIYFRDLTGDELGNKFIVLRSPSRIEKSSKLSLLKKNLIAFDVTKMDDKTLEHLHEILISNKNIYYLMGYTSALEKVANYFQSQKYIPNYSLKAVVSCSEILTNTTMQKLKDVFGCSVYDRYSNEDNGFISQTDGVSHDFIVNRASYFIEILKLDSDDLAEENELGRIVITDYFNYAQPFIRYDTGDLGAFSFKVIDGANRYVLTKVAGRISDVIYDMEDKPISTFAIGSALEVFNKIKQYQLIQNEKNKFILNIIDPGHNYKSEDFKNALEDVLGKGLTVDVNYIDSIPVLNSGKFKRIICNYKPESDK